jgi:5-enolpyruvylshikimate-3-phosphate synthase
VMRFLKTGELLVDDLKAVETSFPGFVNAWE